MKINKIQNEIIKNVSKGELLLICSQVEDKICVANNLYCCFFIPEEKFLLNTNKITEEFNKFNINNLLKGKEEFENLTVTNRLFIWDKIKIFELKNAQDEPIYLNEKYVKYFESPGFKGSNLNKIVLVYENNELVGAIAPMTDNGVQKK